MLISGMENTGKGGAWQRLKAKFVDAVVQDCPPEMSACEVCRKLHCTSAHWIACENRLAAERYLRAGDRAALEALRTAHACGCKAPGSDPLQRDGAAC